MKINAIKTCKAHNRKISFGESLSVQSSAYDSKNMQAQVPSNDPQPTKFETEKSRLYKIIKPLFCFAMAIIPPCLLLAYKINNLQKKL